MTIWTSHKEQSKKLSFRVPNPDVDKPTWNIEHLKRTRRAIVARKLIKNVSSRCCLCFSYRPNVRNLSITKSIPIINKAKHAWSIIFRAPKMLYINFGSKTFSSTRSWEEEDEWKGKTFHLIRHQTSITRHIFMECTHPAMKTTTTTATSPHNVNNQFPWKT